AALRIVGASAAVRELGSTLQRCADASWNRVGSIGAGGTGGSAGQVAGLRSWWAGFGSTAGSRAGHGRADAAPPVRSRPPTTKRDLAWRVTDCITSKTIHARGIFGLGGFPERVPPPSLLP